MSKALATKNVAAVLLGIGLIASTFAFAVPANAQSVSDLNAQIQALLAQIAALQGGSSSSAACTTFTLNLKMGSRGAEVMAVQKFLNSSADTRVAASGAGSPGNETSYFGAATRAAVIKFQEKYAADVLTPSGLTRGTGNWYAATRAKANALCASNPGTGNPGNPGPVVPGTLSVSASAQPSNSLAPAGAARVPFTNFVLSNGSNVAVTVTGVVVERRGLASDTNFDSIVLLDSAGNQVGNSKLLNTNHQATIGDTFVIQPGATMMFSVAANMGDASEVNGGELGSFAVIGVNTTATVGGSLPIVGATHTMNDTLDLGSPTATYVTLPGADASKPVGTMGYSFSTVRITAGSEEDVRVNSIRWNQSGSAASSDLGNVVVVVDGVNYPATISTDGKYYTATFSNLVISKGLSKEFTVKADIVGGAGRTAAFDIYRAVDINMTGVTFGYGLTIEDGNSTSAGSEGTFDDDTTPAFNGYDVTIQAGTVNSVSKSNTVAAGNIAESVPNTNLGAFEITLSGEAIQIQTMKFAIDLGGTVGAEEDGDDFTNVTLVNQNGAVLAGPVNGSATDYTPTGGTASEGSVTFNSVTLPVGTTVLILKGQLSSDFEAADTVTIRVNPADWTGVTGQTTGNSISLTSSQSSANVQTLQAASLVATNLTQPAARTVVKGVTDFVFAQASLDASNSGEDIRVTAIAVKDTTDTTEKTADIDNVEIWADLTSANSARGDAFETMVADAEQFTDTDAGDDETISITLDNPIVVPKNTVVRIAVVADVNGSASGSSTHTIDIDSVTASGVNTGTTASDTSVDGAGQAMTLSTGGTLTVSVDSSSPTAKLVLDNTVTSQDVGVFRLAANNVEDLDLDKIKITEDGSDVAVATYTFKVNGVSIGSAPNVAGTATLNLADGTVTIPANGQVLVTVGAIYNDIDGSTVTNGLTTKVTIEAAGDVETTGKGSGTSIDSTQTSVDAATHTLYEAYPVISFDPSVTSGSITGSTQQLVAKLIVTNPGDADVTFQSGDSNLISLQVTVVGDDTAGTENITLKDQDGTTLDTATITSASGTTQVDFNMSSVGATVGLTIPAGTTKTLSVFADTSDLEDDGDLIQISLDDTAADVTFGIDGSGAFTEGDWIFRNDPVAPGVFVNPS